MAAQKTDLLQWLSQAANMVLAHDSNTCAKLKALSGKVLAIHIIDWQVTVFALVEVEGGLSFSISQPDSIDGTLSSESEELFGFAYYNFFLPEEAQIASSLRYDGDIAFAQEIENVLGNIKPDWYELLAAQVGNVQANRLVQLGGRARSAVGAVLVGALEQVVEYATDEARAVVGQLEYAEFTNRVRVLRHSVARLEARLQELQAMEY